ncbi:hypothetical protein AS188_15255 [Kocuria flava]|uniref:Uncharacterized protein n=1 Tax=Kocuria flava TaxID=446860 RepID=A0A0U3GCN6_9MICC|nr:hypothetical protein [Kocuria flava]ALU40875.1 hypothetical protein AS188_15255 [Kocuria flava]GEO93604.1 hypothetical protein KFL01_29100 [Kocuria flava]
MNAAARLGLYAAGLAVIFTAAFATAGAVVPEETVTAWTQRAEGARTSQHTDGGHDDNPVDTAASGHNDY